MHPTRNQVVLVNRVGDPLGTTSKLLAHQTGQLHLAFSVMLVREGQEGWEYLLQKRAASKYHSANLWANTCCSHPQPGEWLRHGAQLRLDEELGIKQPLNFVELEPYLYRATLDNGLIEHEFDHILIARIQQVEMTPNPDEVQQARWWKEQEIEHCLANSPEMFSAWFNGVYMRCRDGKWQQHIEPSSQAIKENPAA